MNKRIKKKHSFKKFEFTVLPGISNDPEECPVFRAFSMKSFFKLADRLKNEYNCEFLWVNCEFPYEKYRLSKGR